MHNTLKRFFIILSVLGMAITGHATVRLTAGGVQYTSISDTEVSACLTVKAIGDVVIPETIVIKGKHYKVVRLEKAYFKKNEYLTSLSIPNTVTRIEEGAVRGCPNLARIVMSETVDIHPQAFEGVPAEAFAQAPKGDMASAPAANLAQPPAPRPESDPIDRDIPLVQTDNSNTFALIIGNENYKRVAPVPYAANDATIFAEYCEKTLGIPRSNIDLITNATQGDMRHGITTLTNRLAAYNGEGKAIVYYAGHGIPDEQDKTAYLLPVDGFASDVESGYSLKKLYMLLSQTPSQQTFVLLDACFSGAKRDGEMLASARGVAIKVKEMAPQGNLLVFTAATGDETAICDQEHHHGVFTYYLLKCLRDSKGNTDLGKLSTYVIDQVRRRSVVINSGKLQTPTVIPSISLAESWKKLKLK